MQYFYLSVFLLSDLCDCAYNPFIFLSRNRILSVDLFMMATSTPSKVIVKLFLVVLRMSERFSPFTGAQSTFSCTPAFQIAFTLRNPLFAVFVCLFSVFFVCHVTTLAW